jgi:heavy metal translocating P-type ATPase
MTSIHLTKRLPAAVALLGLASGGVLALIGHGGAASIAFAAGTVPVAIALAVGIARDVVAGRYGVDVIALMAMIAALAFGETLAGAVVALMYAGGILLEDFALGRAERELSALVERAPRRARVRRGTGTVDVPVDAVAVGDEILVGAGEVIPVDGTPCSGSVLVDEATVTGEPIPVERRPGDALRSGTLNAGESFAMQATAIAGESTYAGIVRMVSAAQDARAPFVRMADRVALFFLPATVGLALAAWVFSDDPIRALAVLVAATPCPLILAAPVAFVSGISRAAKRGVLIKGGAPLEALARANTLMLDKTGTLTVGGARVAAVEPAGVIGADEILRLCASLEQASRHVVAAAIVAEARARGLALTQPEKVAEQRGAGILGRVDGRDVVAGGPEVVFDGPLPDWAAETLARASERFALTVFVAVDGVPAGTILLADELKPDSAAAIAAFRASGIRRIVMLTGDGEAPAARIARDLDLDGVLAQHVPAEKLAAVRREQALAPTAMVGDGINDAPALAAADVGIAMGARGATASSQAADVVVLVDRLDRVAEAFAIARRTRRIAAESIAVGMGLSLATMVAAALGYVPPVTGALIQEGIDLAVILNALRALR